MNERFFESIQIDRAEFMKKIHDSPIEELYLITPEYLNPYLNYIKQNRRLFKTMLENAAELNMEESYLKLFRCVFTPILDRFQISDKNREYMMAFYIHGLMAIINQWLKDDCREPIERIIAVMRQCVMHDKDLKN